MSFYPQFEDMRKLFEAEKMNPNELKMRRYVGKNNKSIITVSLDDKYKVIGVDNYKRDIEITEDILNNFEEGSLVKIDLENYIKDKDKVIFGEFWDHQIIKYKDDIFKESKIKEEKKEDVLSKLKKYLDEEDAGILIKFYSENNKSKEFESFIENLPTSENFLSNIRNLLETIVSCVEMDNKEYKKDVIYYIAYMKDIKDLENDDFLKNNVLKKGTFINDLFNIESIGIGKGELLITYLFKDTKIRGTSEDYDISFENGEKYEIKEYTKRGKKDPIRLSGAGSPRGFDCYDTLVKTTDIALNLHNNFLDELQSKLHPSFYELWLTLINEEENKGVGTKRDWDDVIRGGLKNGELNIYNLNKIILWYYFANDLVTKYDSEHTDISKEIIDKLKSIEYVISPEKLKEDFNKIPQEYFDKVRGLTAFIIFRGDKIRIEKASDLRYARVSQHRIRLIEADLDDDMPTIKDTVFKKYKEAIESSSIDISLGDFFDKEEYEEHLKKVDFYLNKRKKQWQIRKDKKMNNPKISQNAKNKWLEDNPEPIIESFYPRLEISEKFTEEGDPIADMNIGAKFLITKWLKSVEVENYTINEDGTIDIKGNFVIEEKPKCFINRKFPDYIQFNYVSGHVTFRHNNVISLKGFPQFIGGYLTLEDNELDSLEGGPKEILKNVINDGWGYRVKYNQLKSLKGSPKIVKGFFDVSHNQLISLQDAPEEVRTDFRCSNNKTQFSYEDVKKVCIVKGNIAT